jgi:DNA invertase Pin-like site-specific DNA recombinase
MNAGAYIRVSQTGEGDSAAEQRAHITKRAAQDSASIVRWIVHEDVSGKTSSADRLAPMLKAVEDGEIETVYIIETDRLSREGAWASVATMGEIVKAGGRVVGVLDGFDSNAAGAAVVLAAKADAAKMYLDTVTARWAATQERNIAEGRFPGMVAYGYRKRDDGTLERDPETAPLVLAAFEARAAGASTAEVAAILGGTFTTAKVQKLLSRRVYFGEIRKGQYVNENGIADPIVPVETWHAAQREPSPVNRRPNSKRLLGDGLARCEGCGYSLNVKDGVLKCVNGRTRGCKTPAKLEVADAERIVGEAIIRPYRSIEIDAPHPSDDLSGLAAALERAKRLALEAQSDDVQDALGSAEWTKLLAKRNRGVESAQAALAKAKAEAKRRPRGTTTVAQSEWDDASLAERIAFVRRDLDLVTVDVDGNLSLWHAGTMPENLPIQGQRGTREGGDNQATPILGMGIVDSNGVRWIFAAATETTAAPSKRRAKRKKAAA